MSQEQETKPDNNLHDMKNRTANNFDIWFGIIFGLYLAKAHAQSWWAKGFYFICGVFFVRPILMGYFCYQVIPFQLLNQAWNYVKYDGHAVPS